MLRFYGINKRLKLSIQSAEWSALVQFGSKQLVLMKKFWFPKVQNPHSLGLKVLVLLVRVHLMTHRGSGSRTKSPEF